MTPPLPPHGCERPMAAESIAPVRACRAPSRPPYRAAARHGAARALAALAALGAVALAVWSHTHARAAAPPGAAWPLPAPAIQSAELWYATAAAPGVWAELRVVVDNPLAGSATKCALLVPGTLLEDFRIRSTEPKLLTPPRRRPDGRYALAFPAPLAQSLNWYRLQLEARSARLRPIQLGFVLDGIRGAPDAAPAPARVFYSDRQADPFSVVPEPLVGWVPGRARGAFPLLVAFALAVGAIALAGCAAAFRLVGR